MIADLSPRGGKLDDLHKTESAYSEIKHDRSGDQVVTVEETKSSKDCTLQSEEGWYLLFLSNVYCMLLTFVQVLVVQC